jgi:hypothetical protein
MQAFAQEVVDTLAELHTRSPHLLHSLQLYLPHSSPAAAALRTTTAVASQVGGSSLCMSAAMDGPAVLSPTACMEGWMDVCILQHGFATSGLH